MKNLTLKKVALGLFLAGYAASGAFAIQATSTATIKGHKPAVNAAGIATPSDANSVKISIWNGGVEITGSSAPIETGYKVKLEYQIYDEDGDDESSAKETANLVRFGYKVGSNWTWETPATINAGSVEWTIPAAAASATALGYMILPTTQYGDPTQADNWVTGNLTVSGAAGTGPANTATPGASNGPSTGDGAGSNGTAGGGSIGPSNPVQPSSSAYSIDIVDITLNGGAVTLGSVATTPQVGKSYAPKVVETSSNTVKTQLFKYKWSLVDETTAAGGSGSTLDVVGLDGATNATTVDTIAVTHATNGIIFEIPTNANVKVGGTAVTGLVAGAQGFILKVETTN
ncbi:hypothetical protein RCS94_01620 [Orbaceae bacterium ac157xtp]